VRTAPCSCVSCGCWHCGGVSPGCRRFRARSNRRRTGPGARRLAAAAPRKVSGARADRACRSIGRPIARVQVPPDGQSRLPARTRPPSACSGSAEASVASYASVGPGRWRGSARCPGATCYRWMRAAGNTRRSRQGGVGEAVARELGTRVTEKARQQGRAELRLVVLAQRVRDLDRVGAARLQVRDMRCASVARAKGRSAHSDEAGGRA